MPNKSISGWTQVPIVAANLISIHYDRLNSTGSQCNLIVVYEVKDDTGAVRLQKTYSQQVGAYPIAVATIVSSLNTVEGT